MSSTKTLLRAAAHRPWPIPAGPWIMVQTWLGLLFAHWRIAPDLLRALLPRALELETFDGDAWVGLTPFRLAGLRARFLPPVPGASDFPEMNLRTYVRVDDKPGVFFFTLEAGSRLAVVAARALYRLPYRWARMAIRHEAGWIDYRSDRRAGGAVFRGRYRPLGPAAPAAPDTLEAFLTERYALYAVRTNGAVLRGEIHHPPWLLQRAEAIMEQNSVPAAHGIAVDERHPTVLHYSARQDTLVWPPTLVR